MANPQKWDLASIQKLIGENEQEGPYLEYKSSDALRNTDGNKNEISKDVSAFANAGGGTIVYGVVEDDNNTPDRIDDGVNPAETSKEWLEQVINSRIHRQIEGIEIFQILLESSNVIYAVNIPQSERAPHQAASNKYYTRRNFLSEPMEEYEIRDVLMRKKIPDISLDFYFRRFESRIDKFPLSLENPETLHGLEIAASIKNMGGGEVNYASISFIIDARLNPTHGLFDFQPFSIMIGNREFNVQKAIINWGGPRKMPIFKSVEYLLFRNEIHINFEAPWLEEDISPFIIWEIRAPEMEPKIGFLMLKLDNNDIYFKKEKLPDYQVMLRDTRNRDFIKEADLNIYGDIT